MRGDLLVQIRSKIGKGAVVGGLAALLFASSIATAEFLARGVFNYGVESADLLPLEVSNSQVSKALLPTQTANLTFRVKNPNPVAVRATATAYEDQIVSSVEGCAEYLDLTAGRHTGPTGVGEGGKSYLYYDDLGAGEARTVVVDGAVTLRSEAPRECEGATWTVKVNTDAHAGT
jgi:hypothetical protein